MRSRRKTLRLLVLAATVLSLLVLGCRDRNGYAEVENAIGVAYRSLRDADTGERTRIVAFTNFAGNRTALSGLASDLLSEQLVKSGKFRVLDSRAADELEKAHNLNARGLTDPVTARRTDRLIQADDLLYGTIGIIDGAGVLLITLTDSETGAVFYKDSFRFEVTPDLRRLDSQALTATSETTLVSGEFLGSFLVSNWQWFWTVVLVPVAAWLIGGRMLRAKDNEAEGEKGEEGENTACGNNERPRDAEEAPL